MIFDKFRALLIQFRRRKFEITPTFLKFCPRKFEITPVFCPTLSKRHLQTYVGDLQISFTRLRNAELSVKLRSKYCKVSLTIHLYMSNSRSEQNTYALRCLYVSPSLIHHAEEDIPHIDSTLDLRHHIFPNVYPYPSQSN